MSQETKEEQQNHLPVAPLTCLKTAEFKSTADAFEGKNTVIDFWTTKCTRCPDALDSLDTMATLPQYANVNFTSIVLDGCDSARNIIEEPDKKPRWHNINHYYMDKDYKELAKETLGMKQVPFYVVLNEYGEIVQKGSKKQVDFDNIPGMTKSKEGEEEKSEPIERVFCLDEDF